MSPQANTLYLTMIATDALQPSVVDQVSDNEMYIGYCSPDCTSFSDKKWLIKRILTDNDGQKIFLSNGVRRMNVAWTDRKNGNVAYAPTAVWTSPETPSEI